LKDGTGVCEFVRHEDMKYAIKKLDDTKFKSHEVSVSKGITLKHFGQVTLKHQVQVARDKPLKGDHTDAPCSSHTEAPCSNQMR